MNRPLFSALRGGGGKEAPPLHFAGDVRRFEVVLVQNGAVGHKAQAVAAHPRAVLRQLQRREPRLQLGRRRERRGRGGALEQRFDLTARRDIQRGLVLVVLYRPVRAFLEQQLNCLIVALARCQD